MKQNCINGQHPWHPDTIQTLDVVDVDQISATIARDCPELSGLGGQTDTLSTQMATDAKPRARAHSVGRPELVRRYQ
jgi:hypothetical protein